MHCIKTNVLNEETDSKCQLYNEHGEAIDHLTIGCPIVANNEYLMRHDKVCAHLHCSICRTLGNEMRDKWHTHTHTPKPKPVYEQEQCCGIKHYPQTEKLQQTGQI